MRPSGLTIVLVIALGATALLWGLTADFSDLSAGESDDRFDWAFIIAVTALLSATIVAAGFARKIATALGSGLILFLSVEMIFLLGAFINEPRNYPPGDNYNPMTRFETLLESNDLGVGLALGAAVYLAGLLARKFHSGTQ